MQFQFVFLFQQKKNSIKVNNYLSSLKPFHTDWRMPPLSVSCIKCAVPISSGFNQTTFLYLSNQGLFNVNRFQKNFLKNFFFACFVIISHSFFFWLYFIVFTGFFTVSLILFSRLCYVFPLYPKRKKKPESFSDKPLNAIYACHSFSSQNHFLKMFKTYTGRTPSEFRDK